MQLNGTFNVKYLGRFQSPMPVDPVSLWNTLVIPISVPTPCSPTVLSAADGQLPHSHALLVISIHVSAILLLLDFNSATPTLLLALLGF